MNHDAEFQMVQEDKKKAEAEEAALQTAGTFQTPNLTNIHSTTVTETETVPGISSTPAASGSNPPTPEVSRPRRGRASLSPMKRAMPMATKKSTPKKWGQRTMKEEW